MATIQTVLGPIAPADLGITYSHDHLIFRPPAQFLEQDPTLQLANVEAAIQELGHFKAAGGQALVEMTTVEVGRSPRELEQIARATGVHIIAATGYNKSKFCEPVVAGKSVDEIAAEMVRDLMTGMDGTSIRAGVIKGSTSRDSMTEGERKVLQAAAKAHLETGAPISTHTEAGTYALEQIELLLDAGVSPQHICIGHLDRKLDWDYHLQVAKTGVFMLFDQISKEKYYPDALRIDFIKRLIVAGHGDQLLLSGDLARESYWPSYGFGCGPGLTYILWRFVPWMLEEGISRADVERMLIHNPARAFAWAN
ncbi:MAG: phosphotriesterase-related protein [Chloroflexota bacterium]|nr:MAG: phosphotriesterase-related protein [Chloroflexota bacterium]